MNKPILLVFLATSLFTCGALCANEYPFAKLSEDVLRSMLLTPDGKDINTEALQKLVQKLVGFDKQVSAQDVSKEVLTSRASEQIILNADPGKDKLDNYLIDPKRPTSTDNLAMSSACDVCASAINVIGNVIILKPVWPKVVKFAHFICPMLTGFTKDVCTGYVNNHSPVVRYVLPTFLKFPYTLCGKFLPSLGCGAPDHKHSLWTIPIPDQLPNLVPPTGYPETPAKEKLTVLWVTDVHLDPEYEPGTVAACTEPLCCRSSSESKDDFQESDKAGKWGDYRRCDLPLFTFQDMLRHANRTHGDEIDLVMVGGDIIPHDSWVSDRTVIQKIVQQVADTISENLPGRPVYFTDGNHDTAPVDCYSLPGDDEEFSNQWLYDIYADVWTKSMGTNTTIETIKRAAYYTTLIKPGWRIISLNDIFCYTNNWFLYGPMEYNDPYDMLKWLTNVLLEAEKNGERVQIIAHIQPASGSCLQTYSWNYYRIIDRFSHIITGQFHGHAHEDFYAMFYDAKTLTQPKAVAFVGAPGTPYGGNNFGYRLYDFDAKTYTLLNYRQYFADLETENAKVNSSTIDWKLEYSAKEAYALPDMSVSSWADLSERMKTNATLLELYRKHYSVSYRESELASDPCNEYCRRGLVCETYTALSETGGSDWCENFYPSQQSSNANERKCSVRFVKRV